MSRRELSQNEWTSFFDGFSRKYRGRPVRLELREHGPMSAPQMIVRDLPLMGIAAERGEGRVKAIEILVGDSLEDHLMHVVNAPSRVSVEQITDGEDDVLVIESQTDPAVLVDFRKRATLLYEDDFIARGGVIAPPAPARGIGPPTE